MVALDESVYDLRKGIQIINERGEEQMNSRLYTLISSNDLRMTRANHSFGKVKREDLFSKPSLWYEIRFVNGKTWLEAHYTANVKDDGKYNVEGMEQGENERQFKLKSKPIDITKNI